MTGPDYYRLLNVPRTASGEDIRHAYVRAVKTIHPDLARADGRPAARLQDLQRAYRCLRDPVARHEHDAHIAETEQAHAERVQRVQRRLYYRAKANRRYKRPGPPARPINWRMVWLILIGGAVVVKLTASYGVS